MKKKNTSTMYLESKISNENSVFTYTSSWTQVVTHVKPFGN